MNVLFAISKGTWTVKIHSNKIIQFLSGGVVLYNVGWPI